MVDKVADRRYIGKIVDYLGLYGNKRRYGLANQVLRADPSDGEGALRLFRSNRTSGFLVFLGMLVVGLSSG